MIPGLLCLCILVPRFPSQPLLRQPFVVVVMPVPVHFVSVQRLYVSENVFFLPAPLILRSMQPLLPFIHRYKRVSGESVLDVLTSEWEYLCRKGVGVKKKKKTKTK